MNNRKWYQAEQYGFTDSLSVAQWAWEFLRRNPEYQNDWAWFWATWQSLEARYGKPPCRDFAGWERDPDAYRWVDDASGECRADQDRLLIECWMGAKWGFYKFPLDPQTDQPVIGEQLVWREVEQAVRKVAADDSPYLDQSPERIALGFDLDYPLREQLETAKRFLQGRQARLRREGKIVMHTVARWKRDWALMLQVLDGLHAGEPLPRIYAVLKQQADSPGSQQRLQALSAEAERLVRGGYRQMLRIPDR
jgi:hypothetical protein